MPTPKQAINIKKEHHSEVQGICVLALGLILLASLVSFYPGDLSWYASVPNNPVKNWIGIVGANIAGALFFVMGYSAYALVAFLFFWSWSKFSRRNIYFTFPKFISLCTLICVIGALFSMWGAQDSISRFSRSGIIGFIVADFLVHYLERTGALIILFAIGSLTLVLTGEFLISPVLFKLVGAVKGVSNSIQESIGQQVQRIEAAAQKPRLRPAVKPQMKTGPAAGLMEKKFPVSRGEVRHEEGQLEAVLRKKTVEGPPQKPNIRITEKSDGEVKEPQTIEPKQSGEYRMPSLELLASPPLISASKLQSDLAEGARTLEMTLSDFNVSARVADIERGPAITRYELEPAPGVKIQKITTLSDDIALAMRAPAVRIVAPIPGKNRVGIEVPNSSTAAVFLKEVLSQQGFQNAKSRLTLAIGKDISGESIIADLADMPHLLIAGTTGAGKTVCVNSLIMSMLFNASPEDVKFLMVDPKMVELTQFNEIPHMLCPAVTDPKRVSAALNWIVGEMESRYSLLSKSGVRNIKAYHEKGGKLPYIVIIVDELADLMQTSAKTIESAITRLAQLSRAVGIHLILATQRPSVDVITGVIKANFPARISFKVASKVDSRTVLDMNGAETLLGKGDLLFMKPGDAKPTRGQCSFVSDDEVHRVIDFIKEQQQPIYNDSIIQQQKKGASGGSEEKDELYDEALKLVLETNQASVSILQRRMRLGYTRAARLIDLMEQEGVVGPYCGSKPREILIDREEWMLQNMQNHSSEEETK